MIGRLDAADRREYDALSERCRSIIDLQTHSAADVPAWPRGSRPTSLGRLSWMFLRLLVARRTIGQVLGERAERRRPAEAASRRWSASRCDRRLSEDLRAQPHRPDRDPAPAHRSSATRRSASSPTSTPSSTRIEQQVELIREQAALSTDPELLSRRIDEITATLGGTGQWIRDQQQVYGAMEDLLTEPPPLDADARAKESQ